MTIREVHINDASRIADIYNHYILNSHCTFEEQEVNAEEIQSRIQSIVPNYPYLVLEVNKKVVAYAYATQWKTRSAYRYTTELSIYVDREEHGKGYGKTLYSALIEALKKTKYKRLIGGIAMPNKHSIKLHENLGFTHSGTLKNVGIKFEKWIDVAYYQMEL